MAERTALLQKFTQIKEFSIMPFYQNAPSLLLEYELFDWYYYSSVISTVVSTTKSGWNSTMKHLPVHC
jgi:hypothetical protein